VFQYYCTSMCGGCHFYMQGWIVVTPAGEKPATPRPLTCSLCLPTYERPVEALAVALGEYLYQTMGCVTGHGIAGRGGIENYNYIKATVPAHNRTAEKIFLTDEEDLVSEEADVSEEIETKSDALHAEEDIALTDDEMAAFQAALSNRGVDQISGEEASQESQEEDTSEGE